MADPARELFDRAAHDRTWVRLAPPTGEVVSRGRQLQRRRAVRRGALVLVTVVLLVLGAVVSIGGVRRVAPTIPRPEPPPAPLFDLLRQGPPPTTVPYAIGDRACFRRV